MLTLDKRLSAVLDEINEGDYVADIGCDHGKIANLAVEITKNPVYAVDISEVSLQKTKTLSFELMQEDMVHCIVGDGLKPLEKTEVDTIVIAGMGGHEIIKILEEAPRKFRKYILIPHQHPELLREYLVGNGFNPYKDYIIECSNKFYPIIVCGIGSSCYTSYQLIAGKTQTDAQKEYLKKQKTILKNIILSATGDNLYMAQQKLKVIEENENK